MKLWMRWVDFQKLRALLVLISQYNTALRAKDLDRLGTEHGILVNRKGTPWGPSTKYHHRRTLERLSLVLKQDKQYEINHELPEAKILIQRKDVKADLNVSEKTAFAEAILRNPDCFASFFRSFIDAREVQGLEHFVTHARPVVLQADQDISSHTPIVHLSSRRGDDSVRLKGEDARQAIHFGLRSWCVEQLSFLDELYKVGIGYTLFAKSIEAPISESELESRLLDMLPFDNDWTMIRVSDFIVESAYKNCVGIAQVKKILERWLNNFGGAVAGIATSERFITGNQPVQLREAILKGFVHPRTGGHVSHIQIHKDILDLMNRGKR